MRYLGHGVGLRPDHYAELLDQGPWGVEWFEVISENYFAPGGRPWAVLERVRRELPVVMHGVALAIADADPISEPYLASLQQVIERVAPAWVSDHLCWGSAGGSYAHDLLPIPYTEEALDHVTSRIEYVQERLGRPLMLENISAYASFVETTMPEWEFLNALAHRTGCSVLLDVNNVYVSSQNLGLDAERFLSSIDPDVVGQIHLAGHTVQGELIVDTHRGPVPEPVWELYRRLLARLSRPVSTLIEWDDQVPEFAEVVAESRRARQIQGERSRAA
jgi:uncharacterized protein (UPF0276 family)